jgi:N-methylhydantoinase A
VTDAHVVLGRIVENQLAGGEMRIDFRRAREAVARVGEKLRLNPARAAAAILRVANSNMERAIRVVSVERGEDPREFPLVAFGGCGGLHACEIAAELGIRTVIAPRMAGALSALGMLLADRARDYSVGALGVARLEPLFAPLEAQARHDLPGGVVRRFVDVRYAGQSYELTVRWDGSETAAAFHRLHEKVYGFCDPERATEIVTLRVRAVAPVPRPDLRFRAGSQAVARERTVWVGKRMRDIFCGPREAVPKGLEGPALITDYGSTTLVPPGWKVGLDAFGNLLLTL